MRIVVFLFLFLFSNRGITQTSAPEIFRELNGWRCDRDISVDEGATGMRFNTDMPDTTQVFRAYGWAIPWDGGYQFVSIFWKSTFHKEYALPKKILVDFNILGTLNVYFMGMRIHIVDTTTGDNLWMYKPVEMKPGWQVFEVNPGGSPPKNIHKGSLDFVLFCPDTTYCGVEIEFNNLRFVYEDGDTALVDPFQLGQPTPVEPNPYVPSTFTLYQNYPNPFNPSTTIKYKVASYEFVTLKIYDVLGNEVATLVDAYVSPGTYVANFTPDVNSMSSGSYFAVLTAQGRRVSTKKMLYLK